MKHKSAIAGAIAETFNGKRNIVLKTVNCLTPVRYTRLFFKDAPAETRV